MKTIKIKVWDETKQEWVLETVTIGNAAGNTTRLDHLEKARKEFKEWLDNMIELDMHAFSTIAFIDARAKFNELF